MSTFSEANQARLSLKMKLSQHAWYHSSHVVPVEDGFMVSVVVKILNNNIRKYLPPVVNGISIKVEVD